MKADLHIALIAQNEYDRASLKKTVELNFYPPIGYELHIDRHIYKVDSVVVHVRCQDGNDVDMSICCNKIGVSDDFCDDIKWYQDHGYVLYGRFPLEARY